MAGLQPSYNPADVMMGQPSSPNIPYVSTKGAPGTLGPEAIRAWGKGPFDPSYRQNLASFTMGQFQRPTAGFQFNPTATFNFGMPTGGGNAPVFGQPMTLLGAAQGGNPFFYTPPAPDSGGNS